MHASVEPTQPLAEPTADAPSPTAPFPTPSDILLLHVTDARPDAPTFHAELERLLASAEAALRAAGHRTARLAPADVPREDTLRAVRAAGVVVVMGGEDVAPGLYGGPEGYPNEGRHEPLADAVTLEAIRERVATGDPLLGICRGIQLLNVALGGDLVQDMGGHTVPSPENYVTTRPRPADGASARVALPEAVMCTHHQALGRVADDLAVIARADDGVVEAVQHRTAPVVGVQFHPEHPETAAAQLPTLVDAVVGLAAVPRRA